MSDSFKGDPGYSLINMQPSELEVLRQSHLVVTSALAWCIGYLEGLGHDVSDRPFIKTAMEPKRVV